jgi:hypothetical protein
MWSSDLHAGPHQRHPPGSPCSRRMALRQPTERRSRRRNRIGTIRQPQLGHLLSGPRGTKADLQRGHVREDLPLDGVPNLPRESSAPRREVTSLLTSFLRSYQSRGTSQRCRYRLKQHSHRHTSTGSRSAALVVALNQAGRAWQATSWGLCGRPREDAHTRAPGRAHPKRHAKPESIRTPQNWPPAPTGPPYHVGACR